MRAYFIENSLGKPYMLTNFNNIFYQKLVQGERLSEAYKLEGIVYTCELWEGMSERTLMSNFCEP